MMKLKYLSAVIATLFAAPSWGQLLPKMPAPSPTPVLVAPKPAPVPVVPVVTAPSPAPVPVAPVVTVPVLVVPAIAPAVVVAPMPAEPVAKPALVAPALSGAMSPVVMPERKPELVAPKLPVTGTGLPVLPTVPPAATKAAEPAAARGILLNPIATPTSNLSGAKVDVSNVKQRIDTTGLTTGAPERKGGLADVARERNQNMGDDDKANKFRNKSGLIGSRVITGSDADTFAGEKINAKHTGDTDNFAGSRQGNAGGGTAGGGGKGGNKGGGKDDSGSVAGSGSRDGGTSRSSLGGMGGMGGTSGDSGGGGGGNEGNRGGGGGGGKGGGSTSEDIATMLRMEGGTPTGDATKDTAELGYAQSVGGGAAYAATKDMSASERKAYWESQRQGQAVGTDEAGRPREDDMGSGGGRLVGTPQMKQQQLKAIGKAIAAKKGAADGGNNDPRVEQGGSGGPVRQVVGNDDKPQRVRGAGTLNVDKVLEINQVVNPTRQ